MSLRCLIIDDEPLAHDVILTHLADIPFLHCVGQFYRATEALHFLSEHEVDLIFLDIRMPKLSGLEFIKTLTHRPIIIITSAFEEYALESFDLDVCDYLLKPFRFDRLLKAANRAMAIYQLKNQTKAVHLQSSATIEDDYIALKADKKVIILKLNELLYLESFGNYVKVWKDDQFILTPRTLTSFEEQLPVAQFIRIHKSFILHKKFVNYLEGNMIILKNGVQLPIGKNYKGVAKLLTTV
ncbi:MAG: response regulator transcription factor [Chitinophagaceae bacterium]|nr:MAG: response regulator transcription factor [Chitinophagaceae bacterium]